MARNWVVQDTITKQEYFNVQLTYVEVHEKIYDCKYSMMKCGKMQFGKPLQCGNILIFLYSEMQDKMRILWRIFLVWLNDVQGLAWYDGGSSMHASVQVVVSKFSGEHV